jgi:hypothetical protein
MLRTILALALLANAAQAAPTASRAVSATPGKLPVLAPAVGTSNLAPAASLSAPTLGESGLPLLSTPVLETANAAVPARAETAAPRINAAPMQAAPAAARKAPLFSKETAAANRADDSKPTAKETAETLAEEAREDAPNELQRQMSAAFDGVGNKPMHVLMTAGEANPYVKTGGLADVVGDVSPGLVTAGHKVSLVLPLYASISPEKHGLKRLPGAFGVPVAGRMETARLWTKKENGVDVYFIENEESAPTATRATTISTTTSATSSTRARRSRRCAFWRPRQMSSTRTTGTSA